MKILDHSFCEILFKYQLFSDIPFICILNILEHMLNERKKLVRLKRAYCVIRIHSPCDAHLIRQRARGLFLVSSIFQLPHPECTRSHRVETPISRHWYLLPLAPAWLNLMPANYPTTPTPRLISHQDQDSRLSYVMPFTAHLAQE